MNINFSKMPYKKERSKADVGMTSKSCRFTEKYMVVVHPVSTPANQYRNTDLVNDAEKILMSCNASVLYVQNGASSLLIIETNLSQHCII